MLWLKWVLGYCLLVALGLWFGYRARRVFEPPDPCASPRDDAVVPSNEKLTKTTP
jgi:hypothetical protein